MYKVHTTLDGEWQESCFVRLCKGRKTWKSNGRGMFEVVWWQAKGVGRVSTGSGWCSSTSRMASITNSVYFVLRRTALTPVNLCLHMVSVLSLVYKVLFLVLALYYWTRYLIYCLNIVSRFVCNGFLCLSFFPSRSVVPHPRDHGGRHPLSRRAQWHNPESVLRWLQHATRTTLKVSMNLQSC